MTVFKNIPVTTHAMNEPEIASYADFDSETGEFTMTIKDKSFMEMVNAVYNDAGPKLFSLNLSMLGTIKSQEAVMAYAKGHPYNKTETD